MTTLCKHLTWARAWELNVNKGSLPSAEDTAYELDDNGVGLPYEEQQYPILATYIHAYIHQLKEQQVENAKLCQQRPLPNGMEHCAVGAEEGPSSGPTRTTQHQGSNRTRGTTIKGKEPAGGLDRTT